MGFVFAIASLARSNLDVRDADISTTDARLEDLLAGKGVSAAPASGALQRRHSGASR